MKGLFRKAACAVPFVLAGALAAAGPANAQDDYPSKPIVLSLHASPGGGSDLMARHLADALKGEGVAIVVENRPGGSGYVNMEYVASQPGDGYTWNLATSSLLSSRYLANLPLSFRDFKPVARVMTEDYAIVASKDSGIETIGDLIDQMKKEAGEVKLGGGMIGSKDSMIAFQLYQLLDHKPAYVPFENGADINVALLGDQLKAAVVNPLEALPQIQSGDFKVLAMATDKRSPFFPDVPTLQEVGYDVIGQQWRGIWVPKDTPNEIVNKAAELIKTAMQDEKFKQYLKDGMLTEAYLGPDDYMKSMEREDKEVAKAIEDLGLTGSEAQ
jgi:putative tricarboxylic transport membrane protein